MADTAAPPAPPLFPVVALGASAGGLAALITFCQAIDADSGLAYVVVVHLAPDRESHLPDLLRPHAPIPVDAVTGTVALEPNRVYVIPAGSYLSAVDTHLRLAELAPKRHEHGPIDHFFRTLAATHDGHSVAVVLTGTGCDGTLGIKDVKAAGGLVVVQDPEEAEYDGMPRSALSTGLVDLVLPVTAMPQALRHLAESSTRLTWPGGDDPAAHEQRILQAIFTQVKARTRRDFSRHKSSTIGRRIQRRMQVRQSDTLDSYLELLRRDAEEARLLANECLINVTSFFRDADVFAAIASDVIPLLFADKDAGDEIRGWSVGCATGEEAYSMAMLLLEHAGEQASPPRLQLFASDLHEPSLKTGRDGFYAGRLADDVGAERLARHFRNERNGYRIRDEVRRVVVFAQHDLLSDPPFSHLDVVICRNVLIYLQRDAQREVIELFHYALKPGGILILGSAEGVDDAELFEVLHKSRGIYRRRMAPTRDARLPTLIAAAGGAGAYERAPRAARSYGALHHQMVERLAPPSVLVGPGEKLVHASERAGRYLRVPGGESSAAISGLIRPELRFELHAALHALGAHGRPVRTAPIDLELDGVTQQVRLHVSAASSGESGGYTLIIFEEAVPERGLEAASAPPAARVGELETELTLSRQRLQTLTEEYETSREEMRAANEELQSANEELRSTLEELETSKEELQSINEELVTLNQENRHRVDELSQLSGDLQHLMAATDIATLFLDTDLRIVRFTPQLEALFRVRSTDRGRPLADQTHRLRYPDLQADARRVLADLTAVEHEVEDDAGRWYLLRLRPYRLAEDRIGGVVLTLVDITAQKDATTALAAARDHAEQILDSVNEPLLLLHSTLRVRSANRAFYEDFAVDPVDTVGRRIFDLGNRQWDIAELRTLLDTVVTGRQVIDDYLVRHHFESVGARSILISARPLHGADLVLLGFRDVTDFTAMEEALRGAHRQLAAHLTTLAGELRSVVAVVDEAAATSSEPLPGAGTALDRARAQLGSMLDRLDEVATESEPPRHS